MHNPKPWLRFVEAGTPYLAPVPAPAVVPSLRAPVPGVSTSDSKEDASDEDPQARSTMTDQEKIQADLEAERKRAEEFKAQLEQEQRKGWARDALAKTGLPAEMADRLRGETAGGHHG